MFISSCSSPISRPPDYLKATFNGVTHSYGTIVHSFSGVTTNISGAEGIGNSISLYTDNNITGTYTFCTSCGTSNYNAVSIVSNGETFESRKNGSIVTTFTNTNLSGTSSGYFQHNSNPSDTIYISGSFSVTL